MQLNQGAKFVLKAMAELEVEYQLIITLWMLDWWWVYKLSQV